MRFRAVDVLERAGISLDDDGRQSIPVLLPAQGADLSATVPEPILPDAVSARFAEFEKETQQLNETGYAALRKRTLASLLCRRHPPQTSPLTLARRMKIWDRSTSTTKAIRCLLAMLRRNRQELATTLWYSYDLGRMRLLPECYDAKT